MLLMLHWRTEVGKRVFRNQSFDMQEESQKQKTHFLFRISKRQKWRQRQTADQWSGPFLRETMNISCCGLLTFCLTQPNDVPDHLLQNVTCPLHKATASQPSPHQGQPTSQKGSAQTRSPQRLSAYCFFFKFRLSRERWLRSSQISEIYKTGNLQLSWPSMRTKRIWK